jgi:hypothetical protein
MKFTVEVGETEKIKIEFSRNWITGAMNTMADACGSHMRTRSQPPHTFRRGANVAIHSLSDGWRSTTLQ